MGAVSPRDCGISLGTYLFYFHFFFYRLRSQITDGMVIVVFGFLAGSADTLVCGERKT